MTTYAEAVDFLDNMPPKLQRFLQWLDEQVRCDRCGAVKNHGLCPYGPDCGIVTADGSLGEVM